MVHRTGDAPFRQVLCACGARFRGPLCPVEVIYPDMWIQKPQTRGPSDPNQSVGCHHVTIHVMKYARSFAGPAKRIWQTANRESVTSATENKRRHFGNFALRTQLETERWTEWDKLYYSMIVLQYCTVRGINKRDRDLILSGNARTSGECKLLGVFL